MYVSIRDLFWIRSQIPFKLRDVVTHSLLQETTTSVTRELLLNEPDATQLALIILLVDLSIEHPERKEPLLKCTESLLIQPDRHRKFLRDFRRELKKEKLR